MSTTSVHKRKAQYDPVRQWGLKPEVTRGSTYVISGHVVSGSNADPRNMYVGEVVGREGQAKAQRKSVGDADRALKALLERDRDGMKAVMLAREASRISSGNMKPGDPSRKGKTISDDEPPPSGKSAFRAEVVKQLGFDPTVKVGQPKRPNNVAIQSKVMFALVSDVVLLLRFVDQLDALESIRKARKEITLGPRSGPKVRSGVVVPIGAHNVQTPGCQGHQTSEAKVVEQNDGEENMIDLDD